MPIEFEYNINKGFDFVHVFAKRFNQPVFNNKVSLPDAVGRGYIKEVYLDNGISLCMHQYRLKQPLIIKRLESAMGQMLTIKFTRNGFFTNEKKINYTPSYKESHSAEITSNNLFTQAVLTQNSAIDFVAINISRKTLLSLLQLDDKTFLHNEILNNTSFVFYERLNTDMEKTLSQIQAIDSAACLSKLQYQTKLFELLFQFFNKLLNRDSAESISINQSDAEKIYMLKASILADLSIPPQLPELASKIGMSETKMKKLFHYIFGQSIYNCFQSARMNEASRMLSKFSVSETGYKLGFTNLSHFARLFEKHYHLKPKRYKDSLGFVNGNGLPLNKMPDKTIL